MEAFRSSPRQADLLIVSGRVAHKMAAPLRQIYDQMLEPKWVIAMGACASSGGMFNNYAILQGVDKIVPVDIYVPVLPAAAGGADGRDHPPARGALAGVPPAYEREAGWRRERLARAPGLRRRDERRTARRRVVVERGAHARGMRDVRDELGFNFLVRHRRADYLDWGGKGVAGYIGTAAGRDINAADDAGAPGLPDAKPERFSISYHLLALRQGARRVRLQCWLDDGEPVDERRRRSGRPPTGSSARRTT